MSDKQDNLPDKPYVFRFTKENAKRYGRKGKCTSQRGKPKVMKHAEIDFVLDFMRTVKRQSAAQEIKKWRRANWATTTPAERKEHCQMMLDSAHDQITRFTMRPLEIMSFAMAIKMAEGKMDEAFFFAEKLAPYTNSKAPQQVLSTVTTDVVDSTQLDEMIDQLTDDLKVIDITPEP